MISIAIQSAGFTRSYSALLGRVKNPVDLLIVSGRELANQLVKWFRSRDRSDANKLSPRRSHFWLAVSRTVGQPFQSGYNAISVTIADPRIAQKIDPKPITPKIAGALTIPVEERAYNRTAATFEAETGLKLILIKTGGKKSEFENAVLAVKEGGGLTVEYILTQRAEQQPDPNALPPKSQLEAAILKRAQSYANNELRLNP